MPAYLTRLPTETEGVKESTRIGIRSVIWRPCRIRDEGIQASDGDGVQARDGGIRSRTRGHKIIRYETVQDREKGTLTTPKAVYTWGLPLQGMLKAETARVDKTPDSHEVETMTEEADR